MSGHTRGTDGVINNRLWLIKCCPQWRVVVEHLVHDMWRVCKAEWNYGMRKLGIIMWYDVECLARIQDIKSPRGKF